MWWPLYRCINDHKNIRVCFGGVGDFLREPSLTPLAHLLSSVGSWESTGEGAEVSIPVASTQPMPSDFISENDPVYPLSGSEAPSAYPWAGPNLHP